MTATETYQTRVNAGVEWLDREVPGWPEKIDLAVLDLNNTQTCVIAQLSGVRSFQVGVEMLELGYKDCVNYGFWLGAGELYLARNEDRAGALYEQLTDTWRGVIARRRVEATQPIDA